jgi:hypothetical protein
MDRSLARGLAKRIIRESDKNFAQRIQALGNEPLKTTIKGWSRRMQKDIEKMLGFYRIETSSESGGLTAIAFVTPTPPEYCEETDKNLGLCIALAIITPKVCRVDVVVTGARVSQHAMERLIQRANLSDTETVINRLKLPMSTAFKLLCEYHENGIVAETQMTTRDGTMIWRIGDGVCVATTFIGKDNMSDSKRKLWEHVRTLNGHSILGAH